MTFKFRKEQSLLFKYPMPHQSPPSLLDLKVFYILNPFSFPNLFPTAPISHVTVPSMQCLSSPPLSLMWSDFPLSTRQCWKVHKHSHLSCLTTLKGRNYYPHFKERGGGQWWRGNVFSHLTTIFTHPSSHLHKGFHLSLPFTC